MLQYSMYEMKSHRIWGYNLKHIILAVFVLLLVGCNQNEKFSKADNLEFAAKTHFTMSNVVISAGGNNSNISANNTLNFSGHNENILKNTISGSNETSIICRGIIAEQFNAAHDDIFNVWDQYFTPLYNAYQYDTLQMTDAADEITSLNNSFSELQKEVEGIAIPESLTKRDQQYIQEIKDDLLLAISNRSLAIIEFKSMLDSDEVSHQEFLDIHINNSEKYLKEVEEGSAKLALENEELITVK